MMVLSTGMSAHDMQTDFASVLSKFLDGSISLIEVQEWLLSNMQTILDSGHNVCVEVANEIDADLISLGEELIDESEFIKRLYAFRDRLQTLSVSYSARTMIAHTTTSQVASTFKVRTGLADLQFHFRIEEFSGAGK